MEGKCEHKAYAPLRRKELDLAWASRLPSKASNHQPLELSTFNYSYFFVHKIIIKAN